MAAGLAERVRAYRPGSGPQHVSVCRRAASVCLAFSLHSRRRSYPDVHLHRQDDYQINSPGPPQSIIWYCRLRVALRCARSSVLEAFKFSPSKTPERARDLLRAAKTMSGMIDPQIFDHLKAKIDEDTQARDELNQIVQKLERDVSYTQGLLSRVHSTPRSACESPLRICCRWAKGVAAHTDPDRPKL